MTNRVFIYPLLLLCLLLSLTLWRQGARWHAGPFWQLGLILLAAVAGLIFQELTGLVFVAWFLFLLFVVAPRFWTGLAWRRLMAGEFGAAANAWQMAAMLVWGGPGQVLRTYATALRRWGAADRTGAEQIIRELLHQPMPVTAAGAINVWLLSVLVAGREWATVVEFYEDAGDWGTLANATQARLLVARAYAEAGRFDRALRCLQFVALAPRTVGELARQLWAARVTVAALAGDAAETERLLRQQAGTHRRGYERFAATWRGRCALANGDLNEGQRQLTRALALTPLPAQAWRAALAGYLRDAQNLTVPSLPAATTAEYQHGQALLQGARQTAAPWRALLEVEAPRGMVLALLVVLALVWLAAVTTAQWWPDLSLIEALGNLQVAVRNGAWWRLVTALFLHTEWWHLLMNATGLWVFGAAVERALGRGRMLLVFVMAGALGNAASVSLANYDVSLGASGGVFALLGAFGVLMYRLDVPLYARYRRQLLLLLTLMVSVDLSIGGLEPRVDNLAHAGGLAAGVLLTWLLTAGQKRGQPRRAHL